MSTKLGLDIRIGMAEIMVCSGVYLFSDSKYLSLSLIVGGVIAAIIRYCMERNDVEERDKSTKKLIKEMCDSATTLSFAKMAPISKNIN